MASSSNLASRRYHSEMSEAATTTSTVSLAIDGMTSRTCVGRVERALSDVPAVLSVAVRLDSESARIELGDMHTEAAAIAAVEALLAATASAGFAARLRGYEGPPVSRAGQHSAGAPAAARDTWSDGEAEDEPALPADLASMRPRARGPQAADARPGVDVGVNKTANPDSAEIPLAPPTLAPTDQAGGIPDRVHHAGLNPTQRPSRRDREAPPAYGSRIEPGFAADGASRQQTGDTPDGTATSPMSAEADPRKAGDLREGATARAVRQAHDRRDDDSGAATVTPLGEEAPPVLSATIEDPATGAAARAAASLPDDPVSQDGTGATITPDALAASDGFAASRGFAASAHGAAVAQAGASATDPVPAASVMSVASGASGVSAAATRSATEIASGRPRTAVTATSPVAANHPRLVEPGRVALTGRNVIISCAVLTVILLLPALLAPLGASLSIPPSLQFALSTVVLLLAGGSVAGSAWQALRDGRASVELLAVAGALSGWLLSLWLWREGQPASGLYFGTAAGVATLALAGQYLVYRTRRKAQDALDRIAGAQPEEATRIVTVEDEAAAGPASPSGALLHGRPLQERLLQVEDLAAGEVIMIRPGDRIPVDAIILNGDTDIDESILTGDATPVARSPGEAVFAGTLNGNGRLFARVERIGPDTTLARVLTRIEDAQASESVTERKVERVIGWLVPLVLVVAVLTGLFWIWQGIGAETALARAITVLVVAFPCALGLAAPAALIAGTRAAARSGILVRDAGVIEALPAIRTVAFEQTGSLTEGRPGVREILPAPGIDRESLLAVTVALEGQSAHPLADAVLRYADGETGNDDTAAARFPTPAVLQVEAEAVRPIEGAGIEGRVRFPGSADDEAVPVFIGSEALMLQQGVDLTGLTDELELARNEGWTVSLVAMARADSDPMLLGAVLFADTPRPGARKAVEALRKGGLAPVMLSPGPTNAARSTGATLGIDETVGELEPQGVDGWVQRAREAGRGVAMVGDAIDDADTLDNADLAIAMCHDSAGRDVAIDRAPLTLMRDDVRLVPAAFDIGRRTYGNLRQNFGWALVFNAIGIPLAAAGVLGPVAAIVTVAAGLLFVQGNALRLGQWRPDPEVTPF